MIPQDDPLTTTLRQPIWVVLPTGAVMVPAGTEVTVWHERLADQEPKSYITMLDVEQNGRAYPLGGGMGDPGRIAVHFDEDQEIIDV